MANKYITQFPIEVEDFDPATKQDKLTAGNGITLNGVTIATDNDSDLTSANKPAQGKAVGDALALKADKTYVDDELAEKANVNGAYPSLTAGLAEQLLSKNRVVDQTPYFYRQTALGKANAARALMKKIVGGSVVWNQIIPVNAVSKTQNGVTFTIDSANNKMHVSGTPTARVYKYITNVAAPNIQCRVNDVIFVRNIGTFPTGVSIGVSFYKDNTYMGALNDKKESIVKVPATANRILTGLVDVTASLVGTAVDFDYQCDAFNLTQMFGSTIADYIYSLEQATEGSGIAKLREWGFFTEDYYEYDPGTIRSVEGVSAKETVGFNLWDEEWEVGYIDSNGANTASTVNIRSKNYIPILPNTTYYLRIGYTTVVYCPVFFYDVDKNFISASIQQVWNRTIVTPSNAAYMRFYINAAYGATYKNDICINLSDPQRNGTYEPYSKHTYPLDSTLTLRGILLLDSDNNLYFDGDEYAADGTVTRKYGIVDLGTLSWKYISERSLFFAKLASQKEKTDKQLLCAIYPTTNIWVNSSDYSMIDKVLLTGGEDQNVRIKDTSYTDAATFKTAMSGVMLVYELATPTTETAEPYTEVQVVDKDGTEQFVTTGIVPVGHVTEYPEDLVGKIDELPDLPETAGSYVLRVTVTSGKASYEWVSA